MPYFPGALTSLVYTPPEQDSGNLAVAAISMSVLPLPGNESSKDQWWPLFCYSSSPWFHASFSVERVSSLPFYSNTLAWCFSSQPAFLAALPSSASASGLRLQPLSLPRPHCLQGESLVTWSCTPSRGPSHFTLATPTWQPGTQMLTGRLSPIILNRKNL